MVMTFASQSIKRALLLSNMSKRVGSGAQEGLEEMVFALCHELSQSIPVSDSSVEGCGEREENGSYMLWYYCRLD